MKCPKCGYIQSGDSECANCGIIFEKYEAYLQKKQQKADAPVPQEQPAKRSVLPLIVLGAVVGGAFTWGGQYFLNKSQVVSSEPQTEFNQSVEEDEEAPVPIVSEESNAPFAQDGGERDGLAGELTQAFAPVGPIEVARNATVSLVAPWGSGSGFFIDEYGTIVTNRHVVQVNQQKLAKLERQARVLAEQLSNERKNIELTNKQVKNIRDKELRNQVVKNLSLRQQQYDKYNQRLEQLESQIATIKQSNFLQDGKVVLIDGSEHTVTSLQISPNHDLALLSIDAYNSPFISSPEKASYVQQGATVYTIGSPVGLSHTVTSGVISGYRKIDGKRFVQVDAPINPGNSGGPLVNAQGQVLGVNTMIINNTEGIGFAIPFEIIGQEFPGVSLSQ